MSTEITINAYIHSFGLVSNKYAGLKVSLNAADGEVDLSPMLQDENNEEAIYITLNKEQCLTLAATLQIFAREFKETQK